MKRTTAFTLLLTLAAVLPGCATTAPKKEAIETSTERLPAAAPPRQPTVEFQEFKLDNGLRVIISERHHAPVYSVAITYNVGSRDEKPGKTGYAHLFEHMMFQGSENVGKAEHFVLISNNGGRMNGFTSFDRTVYFETLPSNQLDLGLFLEADRMRSLDITQENLDNQRNAVKEERRMRYDNRPYGTVLETLLSLAFDNSVYGHPVIGSMEDLDAATIDDIREFFRLYYAPNNATLVLVGDVDTQAALKTIEKYFADIPAQPTPGIPDLTVQLNQGERRETLNDPLAPQARIDMIYPAVPAGHDDTYPLEVLAQLLGGGESSRLYQLLVKEKQLATRTAARVLETRGAHSLWIIAMLGPGQDPKALEQAVDEEITRLRQELVSPDELLRTKTSLRSDLVDSLETSTFTAINLGEFAVYFDDPDLFNQLAGKYEAVTAQDVQSVANKYLQPSNRALLTTLPAPRTRAGAPDNGDPGTADQP